VKEKRRKSSAPAKPAPKKKTLPKGRVLILDNHPKHGWMAMFYPDGGPRVTGPYRGTEREAQKDLDSLSEGYDTRPY
jgi:hypothetical protein